MAQTWTEDRVATLTKMWSDGQSASTIAKALGGVTRNAVIGKVHRLGLSGQGGSKNTGGGAKTRRKTVSGGTRAGGGTYSSTRSRPAARTVGATALKVDVDADAQEEVQVEVRARTQEDVVVPISKKLTLMDLTEFTCKWPTGDPTRPGFSFCGHSSKEDTPYCEYHSKLAFQPASERRRRR